MKKVMALFLAMLLCMALSVSALGSSVISGDISGNTPENKNPTAIAYDTKLQEPVIKVTVPTAAQTLVLNPYNIKLTSDQLGVASGDTTFGQSIGSGRDDSILGAKLFLKNESNVPLKMSVKATGTVAAGSKATFATAPVTEKETTKKVFLFVDVGDAVKSGDPTGTKELSNATYASTNKNQAIIKAGDTLLTNVLDIPTPSSMGSGINSNYATIQVGGNCTTTPAEKWLEADKVTLKLVFTFQATNNNKPAA